MSVPLDHTVISGEEERQSWGGGVARSVCSHRLPAEPGCVCSEGSGEHQWLCTGA